MKKLFVLFVFALFINGCGKSDDPVIEEEIIEVPELPEVSIVDVSGDSEWDYWVVTKGDYFFIKEENGEPNAIYYYNSTVKKDYTMFFNDDGKVDRLQVEGYTFLFKNYHNNLVDIAAILPDGQYEIIENIELSEEHDGIFSRPIAETKGSINLSKSLDTQANVLKAAARAAGAVGCAVSTFSAIASAGLAAAIAVPAAIVSCGMVATAFTIDYVNIMNSIGGDQILVDSKLEFVNKYGSRVSVVLSCGSGLGGNPVDVVSCIADIASLSFDKAADDRTTILEIRNSIPTIQLFYEGYVFTVRSGLPGISGGFGFGEANIGETVRKFFVIQNKLPGTIHIEGIELPLGYTAEWTNGDIGAYGEKNVFVNFSPPSAGDLSGTIKVLSSYPNVSNDIGVDGIGINRFIGTWKATEYDGYSVGTTYDTVWYGTKCPNTIVADRGVKSAVETFGDNNVNFDMTYMHRNYDFQGANFNVTPCTYTSIIYIESDGHQSDTYSYLIVNGNTIIKSGGKGWWSGSFTYEFIDSNTLRLSSEKTGTYILKKQ